MKYKINFLVTVLFFLASASIANASQENLTREKYNKSEEKMLHQKPIFQKDIESLNNKIIKYNHTEKVWSISRGSDLRNLLDNWSRIEGWSLVWESEYSYVVQANADFKGDYISAVKQIFTALSDINPNLYAELYQGNNVLKVSNQPR